MVRPTDPATRPGPVNILAAAWGAMVDAHPEARDHAWVGLPLVHADVPGRAVSSAPGPCVRCGGPHAAHPVACRAHAGVFVPTCSACRPVVTGADLRRRAD